MKKNFNCKFLGTLIIPIVGISLVIPVFAVNNIATTRLNLWTTDDNALAKSIALGIAPDIESSSFAGSIN